MKYLFILLFTFQAQAGNDINESEKKSILEGLKNSVEINNLKNKIKDNVKLEVLEHSVKTIAEQTLTKIKNTNSKEIIMASEAQVSYWGDCLYKVFKVDGVKAAKAARDVVINNGEKRRLNLKADQEFAFKTFKSGQQNLEECFSKIKK